MIDFIKLRIDNFDTGLLTGYNHIDTIASKYKKKDEGEAFCTEYLHKKMTLTVFKVGYAELKGSWHYYFNDGEHNHNDFTLADFCTVTNELSQLYKINLWECRLMNLETGVNITPPVSTDSILSNLISHRKQMFSRQLDKGKTFYEAKHQRYYVKIYDKALQNNIKDEILRFELKYVKMYDLNNNDICTLSDLLKPESIKYLKERVLNELSNVLLFDPTIKVGGLTKLQRTQKIHHWANPNYWRGLTKSQTYKQGKIYSQILRNHSDNILVKLKKIIAKKIDELTEKGIPFNHPFKNQKGIPFNPLYSRVICHPKDQKGIGDLLTSNDVHKRHTKLPCLPSENKIIRRCKMCQSDISDFPRALFCNEECRDAFMIWETTQKLNLYSFPTE